MNIEGFHHIIRAAAGITGETVFVVVGSQAILAQFPNAPRELLASQELGLYPKFRPELADLIEGSIGRESLFHGTFGYYADGVGPETSKLPRGWESRSIEVSEAMSGEAAAICPEIHDLIASKMVAGRDKDVEWVGVALRYGLADKRTVGERIGQIDADGRVIALARERVLAMVVSGPGAPMGLEDHG